MAPSTAVTMTMDMMIRGHRQPIWMRLRQSSRHESNAMYTMTCQPGTHQPMTWKAAKASSSPSRPLSARNTRQKSCETPVTGFT